MNRTRRWGLLVLIALGVFGFRFDSVGQDEQHEVDHWALATLLITDQNFERGEQVLKSITASDRLADQERWHWLNGLLNLGQSQYEVSLKHFQKAGQFRKNSSELSTFELYYPWAQAAFQVTDYIEAIKVLDLIRNSAEPDSHRRPKQEHQSALVKMVILKSVIYWKQKKHLEAWSALNGASFSKSLQPELLQQKFRFAAELGLSQMALDLALNWLKSSPHSKDWARAGAILRQHGHRQEAAGLLERGRQLYPQDEDISVEMAQTYLDLKLNLSAADTFHQISVSQPKYSLEAAELYARCGHWSQAQRLNLEVTDEKQKLKQQLGFYVGQDEFEKAQALGPLLKRKQMLEDEEVAYSLGFAQVQVGQWAEARGTLSMIKKGSQLSQVQQLLQIVANEESEQAVVGYLSSGVSE